MKGEKKQMSGTIFATRYNPNKGIVTNSTEDSMTDITMQADTDIYALIDKYGIKSLLQKTKPEHELFIDTTIIPKNMTLAEAINIKNNFTEYFENAPATFRKLFKDNPDNFYEAYRAGEYDTLIKSGALTENQVRIQKEQIKKELYDYKAELLKEVKNEIHTDETKTN